MRNQNNLRTNKMVNKNKQNQRNNNTNQVKKVRFDNSQQWRLNRQQMKANAPNRKIIQKNLSAIKNGATPLKRAQAAYYGNNSGANKPKPQNRSPLLVNNNVKRARINTGNSNAKLPVHARLGARPANNIQNNTRNEPKTKKQNAIQQLLTQKRALRIKTKELDRLQMKAQAGKRNNQISQQSRPKFKVNQNNFRPSLKGSNNVRVNVKNRKRVNNVAPSTTDLCVSVANDLVLKRQILTNNGLSTNRPRLNRHVNEVNPQLQQEISLIQERSRRRKIDPSLASVSGLNLNQITGIRSFSTDLIDDIKPTIISPLSQLIGVTSSIEVPQPNRQKLSLHERFSLL